MGLMVISCLGILENVWVSLFPPRLEYVLPAVWFPCPWRSRYCGQRWASCPTHKHKCWEHGIRISAGPYRYSIEFLFTPSPKGCFTRLMG